MKSAFVLSYVGATLAHVGGERAHVVISIPTTSLHYDDLQYEKQEWFMSLTLAHSRSQSLTYSLGGNSDSMV
jgi:hypothetical protein